MTDIKTQVLNLMQELNLKTTLLFKNISGKEMPISFNENAANFKSNLINFKKQIENNSDIEKILSSARNSAIHAGALKRLAPETLNTELNLIEEIYKLSENLQHTINSRISIFNIPNEENENFSTIYKSLEDKKINELAQKSEQLEQKISTLNNDIRNQLDITKQLYEDTKLELQEKKNEINTLLEAISGGAIAGSFEKSAIDERQIANWLRYGSLTCMALSIVVIGYSFWETTQPNFNWENSLVRMILTLFLSIPSAYLARESTKHRAQQYNHLQTSLDLKAINPYIASLPIEEQHKIKITVADRIFSAKSYSESKNDSYPLNTQEIIMELLKKIDIKRDKN